MLRWFYLGLVYALMCAHLMFHGMGLALCALPLAVFGLLVYKRRWTVRVNQVALVLMSAEWFRTAYLLVHTRMAMGEEWMRAGAIIGLVGVATLLGAVFLQAERVLKAYR